MSSWELSPIHKHALSVISASSLVSANGDRIIARDPLSLQITLTWKLPLQRQPSASSKTPLPSTHDTQPHFTSLSLSPAPSNFILAFAPKANAAWIIDPTQESVVARVDVGDEGAVAVAWSTAPAADTVLVWSAHHLRISIYRVANPNPVFHIVNPKLVAPAGYSFRPADSRYLAVVERHSARDHIGIYDTASWKPVRHFPLPSTSSDVADLAWSPCGRYIAVWESLTDYIIHIYTPDGRLLSTFAPYACATAYDPTVTDPPREQLRDERSTEGLVGLGIRTVSWHPTGDWISIGGWDGKIRILTRLGWATVAELDHPVKINAGVVWREPSDWIEKTRGKGIVAFEVGTLPTFLTPLRADLGKVNPKMGVATLLWSPSGRWLASHHQSHPTLLWLYQFISQPSPHSTPHFRPRLHSVLIHHNPLRSLAWQPPTPSSSSGNTESFGVEESREMVAIATSEKGFTTWREPGGEEENGMAEGVGVPARAAFAPSALAFSPAGDALLLSDRETYAVAFPVGENEPERTWIGGGEV